MRTCRRCDRLLLVAVPQDRNVIHQSTSNYHAQTRSRLPMHHKYADMYVAPAHAVVTQEIVVNVCNRGRSKRPPGRIPFYGNIYLRLGHQANMRPSSTSDTHRRNT